MVMASNQLTRMRTHNWLMGKGDDVFHAYLTGRRGQASVCGVGEQIGDIQQMQIPGDRSKCCSQCMHELYGFSTFRNKP